MFAKIRQRPGGLEQMQLSTDQGAPACLVMTRLALPVGLVFGTKSGDGRPLNPTVMEDAGRHGVHAQDLWAWETSGTAVIEPAATGNPNGGLFTVLCTILVPSDHILLWILYRHTARQYGARRGRVRQRSRHSPEAAPGSHEHSTADTRSRRGRCCASTEYCRGPSCLLGPESGLPAPGPHTGRNSARIGTQGLRREAGRMPAEEGERRTVIVVQK